MKLSWTRLFQWIGILTVLIIVIALRYEAPSDAKKTLNTPFEDRTEQGMLGYWKLDDGSGTNATDSSGNSNTLSMTGSPGWVTGNIGPYALDFNGSLDYLSVADPSSGVLDFTNGADFTISGWFNRDTFANDHTIVAKRNSQSTNTDAGYIIWVDDATDTLNATVGDGGGTASDQYTAAGTTAITATGWHHFSIVWDDSNGLFIYLDGKLDGSTTSSTTSVNSLANALAFTIGVESDAGNPFDGKLDDIKLYSKALSADQVLKLYQTTIPATPVATAGLDSGLVGYWTFDGPDVNWGDTTSEIKDVSGKGNHGDASGLTTVSVTPGKFGQALSFNGTSDYVSITNSTAFTDVSVSLWVYPMITLGADQYRSIFGKSGVLHAYYYCNSTSCRYQVALANPSCSSGSNPITPAVLNNVWHHVVVTFNDADDQYIVYENGSTITMGSNTCSNPLAANSNPITIGYSSYVGAYFIGKIDDVRVYNRTLSASEAANLYTIGR